MGRSDELRRKLGLPLAKPHLPHFLGAASGTAPPVARLAPSSRSTPELGMVPSPLFSCLIEKMEFSSLAPISFEEIVRTTFECFGLTGTLTSASGDHGIDIELRTSGGETAVVQCKRYLADQVVSPREVREFLGAIVYAKAHEGFFVSTSRFSKQCYEFSRSQPVYLIDRPLLKELFRQAEINCRSPSAASSWSQVRDLIATRSASAQATAPGE
ncbi:MAG: restriction endonuclease [Deferrisomatales bacterium]